MIYGYPKLGRTGLGNQLFPWARCELFCRARGVPMLAPQWTQFRIGPILRGEKDWRFYAGLFRSAGYVRGLKRRWVLATGTRLPETAEMPAGGGTSVVEFEGMGKLFEPLLGHREFLSERLHAILTDRTRAALDAAARTPPVIGVHVRRGDFVKLNWSIPDEFYLAAIREVRRLAGADLPVALFSDGTPDQLAALLAEPNVTLQPTRPAIVDILLMARSRVVINSGGSTFSQWASYLGAVPTVWPPGTLRPLAPDPVDAELRAGQSLPDRLQAAIRERLGRGTNR